MSAIWGLAGTAEEEGSRPVRIAEVLRRESISREETVMIIQVHLHLHSAYKRANGLNITHLALIANTNFPCPIFTLHHPVGTLVLASLCLIGSEKYLLYVFWSSINAKIKTLIASWNLFANKKHAFVLEQEQTFHGV